LSYDLTIDDPNTWTKPWTIHMPYQLDKSYAVYEYACHEGNYMMLDALTAARQMDAQGKETKVSSDNFVRPAGGKQ
jgi:alpha-L-fucosidase